MALCEEHSSRFMKLYSKGYTWDSPTTEAKTEIGEELVFGTRFECALKDAKIIELSHTFASRLKQSPVRV